MSNRIPKSIQTILERAEDLRDQAAQQHEVREEEEAVELKLQRDQEWKSLWSQCGQQLPQEIRRFARQPYVHISFDLSWKERAIPIRINGLAPFIAIFDLVGQGDGVHLELGSYRCPAPVSTRFDEPGEVIWDWHRSYGYLVHVKDNVHALEDILLKARDLVREFQGKEKHEQELRIQDAARDAERQQRQDQEKVEEDLLLEAIKKDPIAGLFLKAFVRVQQERSGFMTQIENANCAAESVENRLGEKLEAARRSAEDARREADDERRRKEDLQDELDKVEKKAKRGW